MISIGKIMKLKVAGGLVMALMGVAGVHVMAADMAASGKAMMELKSAISATEKPVAESIPTPIADIPLTKEDAEAATKIIWDRHASQVRAERAAELKSGELKLGDKTMPFTYKKFGTAPKEGHSLWISMHGGGGAPKAVNDRQGENQKRLYKLEEGIYLVPRAPTDTWDLWHQGHIDPMYTRLIEDMIIVEGVNPNRVYIMGYSAGGDGVFQLAPRMADQLAAAAMMAGHPNETQPTGLRNLPFALQMGGNDKAYNRNGIAREWAKRLDELQKQDPKGYEHFVKIYEGKGHWMDGEDKVAIPWMQKFSRNLNPDKVAWRQDDVTHSRFYWLAVDATKAKAGQELVVSRKGQTFEVEKAEGLEQFQLVLNDRVTDLDKPIQVSYQGKTIYEGSVPRTIANIVANLRARPDPETLDPAVVKIILKQP